MDVADIAVGATVEFGLLVSGEVTVLCDGR
jgi:hypothetical protein